MTKEEIISMARKAELLDEGFDQWICVTEDLERFAQAVRAAALEEALNCYSSDDSANDWADKIRALKEALRKDAERLDWIAIHGTFGVDSITGEVGGNGQKRLAATRKNIDAAKETP